MLIDFGLLDAFVFDGETTTVISFPNAAALSPPPPLQPGLPPAAGIHIATWSPFSSTMREAISQPIQENPTVRGGRDNAKR